MFGHLCSIFWKNLKRIGVNSLIFDTSQKTNHLVLKFPLLGEF